MTAGSLKTLGISCALAIILAMSASSFAGVLFCADGTGASCAGVPVSKFLWEQNSVLAEDGFNNNVGATALPAVLHGQGLLTRVNGVPLVNTSFTYVYSIPVMAEKTGIAVGDTVTFVDTQVTLPTAVTATNYFRMYVSPPPPPGITDSQLDAGIFAIGTLILEGAVYLDSNSNIPTTSGVASSFQITNTVTSPVGTAGCTGHPCVGGNPIETIAGTGQVMLDINALYADPAFFRSDITSLLRDLDLLEIIATPFVAPNRVSSLVDGVVPYYGALVNSILLNDFTCNAGTITCDMMYDHSAELRVRVAEPGTLALLCLGLVGLLGFRGIARYMRERGEWAPS